MPTWREVMFPGMPLGRLSATPGAMDAANGSALEFLPLLQRHSRGDWGNVSAEDKAANDRAVEEGTRVVSAYVLNGTKVWIITEADRSVTTIMLPEEY